MYLGKLLVLGKPMSMADSGWPAITYRMIQYGQFLLVCMGVGVA